MSFSLLRWIPQDKGMELKNPREIKAISIEGNNLSIEDIVAVARFHAKAEIPSHIYQLIQKSRQFVEKLVEEKIIEYGITTGVGSLQNVLIPADKASQFQHNIILSHCCGAGEPFPEEVVRAMMLLRLNTFACGYSGVSRPLVETLLKMLNKKVHPLVPQQGSVGASGDLCPLAHIALVLIGRGEAIYEGKKLPGKEALKLAGINPLTLGYKEGLALINGTQAASSIAALAIYDGFKLMTVADIAGAMTLEALKGLSQPFEERVQKVRNYLGQLETACNIRKLIEGSELVNSDLTPLHIQDSYSLRCIPQVHGATREALKFAKNIVDVEINSAIDNPLIFPDDGIVAHSGNFHGQPIGLAMDTFGLAIAELGSISERRIAKLLDKNHNQGLPPFLSLNEGINTGLMLLQYTAASLVSENKILCHPATCDSIPTSANQEDHNSMATIAARKARTILDNVCKILAIELICAFQAISLRGKKPGKGVSSAMELISEKFDPIDEDRELYYEIDKSLELISTGILVEKVQKDVGELY